MLALLGCEILGKSLTLSEPLVAICEMGSPRVIYEVLATLCGVCVPVLVADVVSNSL